jgi:hypothetical protein
MLSDGAVHYYISDRLVRDLARSDAVQELPLWRTAVPPGSADATRSAARRPGAVDPGLRALPRRFLSVAARIALGVTRALRQPD